MEASGTNGGGGSSVRWGRRGLAAMRWLHIYASMFGLAAVLFFSVTGLTLNHPDWFLAGAERRTEGEGKVGRGMVEGEVDRLGVVELLRSRHEIHGGMSDFQVDEYECAVSFRGPGYQADAFIDRETGGYRITEIRQGLVAVINDLHKGRDTGNAWSWVIDVSAVLTAGISVSGLVLLLGLRRRRGAGLLVALIGGVLVAWLMWGAMG